MSGGVSRKNFKAHSPNFYSYLYGVHTTEIIKVTNSVKDVLIIISYFTVLNCTHCLLSPYYHHTLLLVQNYHGNIALMLQPYFYYILQTPHMEYWVWL